MYREKGLQGGARGLAQNKAGRVGLGSVCQARPTPAGVTPSLHTQGPRVSAKAHSPRQRPQPSPSAWESRLFCSHLHPPFSLSLFLFFFIHCSSVPFGAAGTRVAGLRQGGGTPGPDR